MDVWFVIPGLVILAVLVVVVPVLWMRPYLARPRVVRCPLTGTMEGVMPKGAWFPRMLARRSQIAFCTRWPGALGCRQGCVNVHEEEIGDVAVAR